MKRWQIKDGPRFLLLCMVHVPALGSAIAALGSCVMTYGTGFARYGLSQIPYLLLMAPVYVVVAVPFGILLMALPGALGGAALLLLSHFRAPTTIEFVFVAALVAGLPSTLLSGGWNGPSPYLSAVLGAVSALAWARGARKRGVIVPLEAEAVTASPAPVSVP